MLSPASLSSTTDQLNQSYPPIDAYNAGYPYGANRDAIRLSTRRALRDPQRRSMDSLQNQQTSQHPVEAVNERQPNDTLDLKRALLTTPPPRKDSSAPSHTTQVSSSDVTQQNASSGFMKTIRRVFSRSKQFSPHETQSKSQRKTDTSSANQSVNRDTRQGSSAQMSAAYSTQGSTDNSNLTDGLPTTPKQNSTDNTRPPRTSRKMEPRDASTAPQKRLRRTTSTVYRVTTLDSNQSTFHSKSPSYYTPSASPRQAVQPAHSSQGPIMPSLPEPMDNLTTHAYNHAPSGPSHLQRDSLDILREKYSSRKSEDKQREGNVDSHPHRKHQKSSSSMSIGVGSTNSPDPIFKGTAPRRVMEAAGLSARLLDLEVRMEEVEYALKKLKSLPYPESFPREVSYMGEESTGATPKAVPTPPSSLRGIGQAGDTFLRSNSSTPHSEEEDSSPSTPTGPTTDSMAISLGGQQHEDEEVLRGSLLDKGYHHTLHRVFNVVNAEHKARVALEADVHALRNMIAALRQEAMSSQQPARDSRQRQLGEHHEQDDSSYVPGAPGASAAGTGHAPGPPIPPPKDSKRHVKSSSTSSGREALEYDDLWSHAAVPLNPQTPPTMHPHHTPSNSNDLKWSHGSPLVSKFSFDDTEDDESGSHMGP